MQVPNLPNIDPKLFRLALIVATISLVAGSWLWFQGRPEPIQNIEISTIETELATSNVFVHVAGEVKSAGVYELKSGSRVIDAIEAAGGVTKSADITTLNLARVLFDGEQIFVGDKSNAAAMNSAPGKISLNQANASELDTLPGIGPVIAARIVEHRTQNGPFKNIAEIKDVSGIGDSLFGKIKDLVSL